MNENVTNLPLAIATPPPLPPGAALAAALAKFQGTIDVVGKDRDVDVVGQGANYNFRYATLAQIWRTIRKALSENGLSVLQFPRVKWEYLPPSPTDKYEKSRGVVTVRTVLCHSSGEQVVDELEMPFSKVSPQAIGSAISYARRYALGAILGITSDDEDDDGAAAGGSELKAPAPRSAPTTQRPPPASPPKAPAAKPMSGTELEQWMESCATLAELSKVGARVNDAGLGAEEQARLRGVYNTKAAALRAP